MNDYADKSYLRAKPHFKVVRGTPVAAPRRESPLEAARRRYGRPFGQHRWSTGEGPAYWTSERVAELAAANERIRQGRK